MEPRHRSPSNRSRCTPRSDSYRHRGSICDGEDYRRGIQFPTAYSETATANNAIQSIQSRQIMKLQLAELTLEKKDGNEQTLLQRLKVSRRTVVISLTEDISLLMDCNRTYDRFYIDINRYFIYILSVWTEVAGHLSRVHDRWIY